MSFATHLSFGRDGERVVGKWLIHEQHKAVVRTSEIYVDDLGPRLSAAGETFVLPDFQTWDRNGGQWVEVKTKKKDAWYGKANEWRQGVDKDYFSQYVSVQEATGLPGSLAFLVARDSNKQSVLRMASLDKLQEHAIAHTGSKKAYGDKELVYWSIDIFDSWLIQDGVVVPYETKPHPWEPVEKPKAVANQGYFDFGTSKL